MGYNTSGLIVAGTADDEAEFLAILRLGAVTGSKLSWLEATSMSRQEMCAGTCAGWWVLIDQTFSRAYTAVAEPDSKVDLALQALSAGRCVLAFAAIGHSDVYGFALYERGRCVRRWLTSEGSIEFDDGVAGPIEGDLFMSGSGVDDETVFHLLDRFVPFGQLTEAVFHVIAPRESRKRKK